MKVCSVILILKGSYELIYPNPNSYSVKNGIRNTEWTKEDRAILIKNCMRDAGQTATNYSQITREYCYCSMDKIMKEMTKDQYEKTLLRPQEEQKKKFYLYFRTGLTN